MHCNVESILGVSESALVKLSATERKAFLGTGDHGSPCFVNRTTGQRSSYGNFQVLTVADLRQRVESMAAVARSRPPDHKKQHKPPVSLTTKSKIDIGELQATTLRTNDDAMVQVASNFNCLENGSISRPPDCGNLVNGACTDRTQGPAAVFGPLSAYLYRAHFVALGEGLIGQTREGRGINLLQNVSQYFGTPINGKLRLQGDEIPVQDVDAVVDQICIGLHSNVPVMFGRNKDGNIFLNIHSRHPPSSNKKKPKPKTTNIQTSSASADTTPYYPKIDQVFNASINMNYIGRMSKACRKHSHGNVQEAANHMSRVLLRASYEGLYLAAIAQERRQLYLTLVGGGSFGNEFNIILQEMQRAHDKWAGHPASRLELCQICLYSPLDEKKVNEYLGIK